MKAEPRSCPDCGKIMEEREYDASHYFMSWYCQICGDYKDHELERPYVKIRPCCKLATNQTLKEIVKELSELKLASDSCVSTGPENERELNQGISDAIDEAIKLITSKIKE